MEKTILITGATDGIGLLTAKKLVSMGHSVIIHGRNSTKLSAVEKELKEISPSTQIQSYIADFSDLKTVKTMAQKLLDSNTKLDVLINNAGIFKVIDSSTQYGIDVRFVVNTLAPYILTQNLLSIMSEKSRVINLSSAAQSPVNIEALYGHESLDDMSAYAQSKLAITMISQHMSKMNTSPIFIAVNPGSLLATKMVKAGFGVEGNDIGVGANIIIQAGLSDLFAHRNGKYFDNDAQKFSSPHIDALNSIKVDNVVDAVSKLSSKYFL